MCYFLITFLLVCYYQCDINSYRDGDFISVAEPELFEPEVKFYPGNGMVTFVDNPPINTPSCIPAHGPIQCSLQGTYMSTDFLCHFHSSKLWEFSAWFCFLFSLACFANDLKKKPSFEILTFFFSLIPLTGNLFYYYCTKHALSSSLVKAIKFWQHEFCRFLSVPFRFFIFFFWQIYFFNSHLHFHFH